MKPTSEPANELADIDAAVDRLTFRAGRLEPEEQVLLPRPPPRFRRIVVAVDGSEASRFAVGWALRVGQAERARAWVVHVLPPPEVLGHYADAMGAFGYAPPGDLGEALERTAQRAVEEGAAELTKAGVHAEAQLLDGDPVDQVAKFAGDVEADLVVLGSHGRGALDRLLLGSVADGVKNHVRCSVLIARTEGPGERVLVAADGSRASKRATAAGVRLARAWDLPATVLHVFEHLAYGTTGEVQGQVDRAFGPADAGWTDTRVAYDLDLGVPAERIVDVAAQARAGLVVMGSRGLGRLRSLVAGSVSNRVAHEAKASVLLVKDAEAVP